MPHSHLDKLKSFLKEGKILAPKIIEDEFLRAATKEDLSTIERMLTQNLVTLLSVNNPDQYHGGGRHLTELALYRLKNNLEGVQLLIEKHQVPIPKKFLTSTESREVAEYLIKEQGLSPYEGHEAEKAQNKKDKYSFFSAKNIYRLCGSPKSPNPTLRSQDYRTIGETLNQLSGSLITKVNNGYVYRTLFNGSRGLQAPHFQCASKQDAEQLCDFLTQQCHLDFYQVYPGNLVYSRESLPIDACDCTAFITAVGLKAGIYEEATQEKVSKRGLFSQKAQVTQQDKQAALSTLSL